MKDLSANVSQQISKPVAEVFEAVVNPEKMKNYFISESTGPMMEGATLTWTFGDAGVGAQIQVISVKPNESVTFSWPVCDEDTLVTLLFTPIGENQTEVSVTETGWNLDREGVNTALDQTQGWMHMLLCLKAYLEFNINLRFGLKL